MSDAYGLYYMRRGKSSAALDFVQKAMKTHARMQVSVNFNRHIEERCLRGIHSAIVPIPGVKASLLAKIFHSRQLSSVLFENCRVVAKCCRHFCE